MAKNKKAPPVPTELPLGDKKEPKLYGALSMNGKQSLAGKPPVKKHGVRLPEVKTETKAPDGPPSKE